MIRIVRYHRLAVLATLVLSAFAGLAVWLFFRQVVVHPRFAALARENVQWKRMQPARRGAICDRRGTLLATSVPVKTVCADPLLVGEQRAIVARALAPLLELPEIEVFEDLRPRLFTRVVDGTNLICTSRYAVLKHKVPLEQWRRITNAMAQLDFGVDEKKLRARDRLALKAIRQRGVFGQDDYQRQYPNRSLAAQTLGFVSSGESEKDEGHVFEDHGVAGLELTLDELLNGVHGWQSGPDRVSPRAGLTAVLTLDAGVQHIVESELEKVARKYSPAAAFAVVLQPRTGEILALANWPTFDPNRPGTNVAAFRNRVISDVYEPGSTFKAITIATALDHGLLTLDERVNCENGLWNFGGRPLHDHHRYGVLTYEFVVAKSSNIGTAKAAVRLGPERLYHAITNFGFGSRTYIPLPDEVRGVVHAPDSWSGISITRIPIGHEVAATPLQMIVATAAIANRGVLVPPRLVDRFIDDNGHVVRRYPTEAPRRVISEAAAREMVRALQTVVSPDGTASSARLDYYTVAGKTGTAEKFVQGTYKSGRYYASFIGFLPAENPELCILVGVDDPDRRVGHMGSVVAAPAFKVMAERVANYLRLPPDLSPDDSDQKQIRPKPDTDTELIADRSVATRNGRPRLASASRAKR